VTDPDLPAPGGYPALSRGDLDEWLEQFTEDAELHEVHEIPDSRVYRGRTELRAWAESALTLVSEWNWEPQEVILNRDERVLVVRVRFTAQGGESGVPIGQTVFHVLELRDGMIAVVRGFLDERAALEAADRAA
jgi:ketosteroid isomerase-like protein